MFFMLKRAEVSRVIPVFQTSPIFVAIMAIAFLGDEINPWQALAIAFAVFGAVLASSTRRNGHGWASGFRPDPRFALLLLAAAMVGGSQILIDISADDIELWNTVTLRGWGMAAVALAVFARPSTIADLARYFRTGRTSGLLFFTEGVLAVSAALLLIIAISRGPVALVGALFGARPAFLFIITLTMNRVAPGFLDESFQRDELVIKFMATAFVVTAIVLIAVS
jgi:drug/metabolite transporter (DMT)-like permease